MAGKTLSNSTGGRDTLAKVRDHLSDVEKRLKSAGKSTQKSVSALQTAFEALSRKVDGTELADLKAHVDELSAHLTRRMDESRAQIKTDLSGALSHPDIDHVREALSKATARLSGAELRQAESIQKVNAQIIRLATAIDNRVRNETREREVLEQRITARLDTAEAQTDERLIKIEDGTAHALSKIGTQVTQLSEELTGARAAIEHRTEGRIYEAALDSQHEIESLKADLNAQLEKVASSVNPGAAPADITPVQRAVAALSARLDDIESRISAGAPAMAAAAAITPAASHDIPPFPEPQTVAAAPMQGTPPLPLPITREAAVSAPDGGPLEFDPAAYANTGYAVNAPGQFAPEPAPIAEAFNMPVHTPNIPLQNSAGQNSAGQNGGAQDGGHAAAQMALHDYDAPADFDPYEAAQTSSYTDNPYASGFPGTQTQAGAQNPYAPPAWQQPVDEAPLDLSSPMAAQSSMADARPGGDIPKAKRSLPAFKPGKLSPRTMRTAASAAALVAVVAAGAWMVKDRLPGAAPQMADVTTQSEPNLQAPAMAQNRPVAQPVKITKATGNMSAPANAQGINPSKPRIDNFASLDAAVAAGNPVAQLQKGLTLLQTGKESEAAPYIRSAANQGLPAAQYYLGNMYENGQGLTADAAQARMLTERAARAGHRIAMYDLALYYIEGKGGVGTDMAMAADWFEKAAQYGMTDAQYNLAVLYERGTGVTADAAEAYSWYAIAGAQGDQDAARRAAQLELELQADTLSRAQAKVARYRPADFDAETNGIFKDMPWNKKSRGNSNVATVQSLLLDLGYDVGVADGAIGPRTREAIKAFERSNGLPETGRVDDIIIQTLKDVAGA